MNSTHPVEGVSTSVSALEARELHTGILQAVLMASFREWSLASKHVNLILKTHL